MKEEREEGS